MNLIVHIGTPKTGTTTIQTLLFENQEMLRSQGFHFLQCAGEKNNRALAACCVNDLRPDDFFGRNQLRTPEDRETFRNDFRQKLTNELSSLPNEIHTVIMSSEQLSERLRLEKEVHRFYDMVSPWFSEIRILCWLREPCDMATSLYSTSLRCGGTQGFQEHMNNCTPDNSRYNYDAMLARWVSVFGLDAMEVRVFDKSAFINGDLICDFISCVSPELAPQVVRDGQRKNTSISRFGQLLLLNTNRFFKSRASRHIKKSAALRQTLVKMVESRLSGGGHAPSLSEYQRIYSLFFELNCQLNKKYLRREGPLFKFKPPRRRKPFFLRGSTL